MVFQSYALYPHLNVRNNMTLALKQEKQSKQVIDQRVAEATRMLNLEDYLTAIRRNSPVASASVSRSAGPSCAIRNCFCSTNRCRTLMQRCA